jgi:hypothetical protein
LSDSDLAGSAHKNHIPFEDYPALLDGFSGYQKGSERSLVIHDPLAVDSVFDNVCLGAIGGSDFPEHRQVRFHAGEGRIEVRVESEAETISGPGQPPHRIVSVFFHFL